MTEFAGFEFDALLRSPLWRQRDLGKPLPVSPHANSVCLPTWSDVIGYEQSDPAIISRLQTGYPRFFIHPMVDRLFRECADRFARGDEVCHAYPTERAARRAIESVRRWSGKRGRLEVWGEGGPFIAAFPREVEKEARKHWRHSGDGISSRRAEVLLEGLREPPPGAAKDLIRSRIAGLVGASPELVYLGCSGMSAIYTAHRAAQRLRPGARSVQFGFSYVDTLKIQQDLGPGVHFLPCGDAAELDTLESLLKNEPISAIFAEFPCNPLLHSPDLRRLSQLSQKYGVPLVIDETLGTYVNVDVLPAADIVATSLTKYFTGVGDVMAGAIIVNPARPGAQALRAAVEAEYEDTLWDGDARRLERVSRHFVDRVRRINDTAERLCDSLRSERHVAEVYYPKYNDVESYTAFRRSGGGYGGLFSMLLRDAASNAPRFFDALRVSKGPNLGTHFSLACPFTLLAHFDELDFVESCGVSRHLIRVSVGLESPDDLIARFHDALASLG